MPPAKQTNAKQQVRSAKNLAAEINKAFGSNIMTIGNDNRHVVKYLSTGLLPIDARLGGGLPIGRYTIFTGAYSTLKTYIAYHAIASCQRGGGIAALIDTEKTYDSEWAESCGIDTSALLLVEDAPSGEAALDAAEIMLINGVDLIVFDSVAAAVPQSETLKRLHKETKQPGTQGALFSLALRKLTAVNTHQTTVLFTNQLREQIGVTFGPTEKQPGGRALGFYASIILNLRKAGKVTRDKKKYTGDKYVTVKEEIAQTFRATTEKSKLDRPHQELLFDFNLETGSVDHVKFLFVEGVTLGFVTNVGARWTCGKLTVIGKEKFLAALAANYAELEMKIRAHYNLPAATSYHLPGRIDLAKTKEDASSKRSSAKKVLKRTQAAGRAASSTMAVPQQSSSKSRTLKRSTR